MRSGENLRDAVTAFGFLVHGELVGPHGLIFVDAALDVPTGEVAAIGAGKSSGAEAAHGSTLPIAVVDHAGGSERGFASSGIFEGHTNAAFPGSFRDGVAGEA